MKKTDTTPEVDDTYQHRVNKISIFPTEGRLLLMIFNT